MTVHHVERADGQLMDATRDRDFKKFLVEKAKLMETDEDRREKPRPGQIVPIDPSNLDYQVEKVLRLNRGNMVTLPDLALRTLGVVDEVARAAVVESITRIKKLRLMRDRLLIAREVGYGLDVTKYDLTSIETRLLYLLHISDGLDIKSLTSSIWENTEQAARNRLYVVVSHLKAKLNGNQALVSIQCLNHEYFLEEES